MNTPEVPAQPAASAAEGERSGARLNRKKRRPHIGWFALLIVFGLFFYSASAAEQLLLGWIYFPLRVIPQMTVDWPTIILGALCAAAFIAALHRTLRWLAGHYARNAPGARARVSFRTTLAAAFALLLAFAAGTAMVGATHQTVWLITGRTTKSAANGPGSAPAFGMISTARTESRRSQQQITLRQVAYGLHNFHEMNSTFPPGGTIDEHGRLMHGWATYIGGYIMSYSAHGIDFAVPWNQPPNDRLFRCALPEFINPSISDVFDKDGYGLSHLAGNVHVLPISRLEASGPLSHAEIDATRSRDDAALRNLPLRIDDIRDGSSNTILIGQAAGNFRPWGHPANVRDPVVGVGKSLDGFGGPPGAGGAHFAMVDGSVRFVSNQVNPKVIRALATPAGDEIVEPEFESQRE
ncbi:MAG TPA: DUF1559 domain-containing protein [Planctomycetaceae bacterium]|nr:DUF1559 domain-containing protein [Planctomycetaceae bacterium]